MTDTARIEKLEQSVLSLMTECFEISKKITAIENYIKKQEAIWQKAYQEMKTHL